MSTRPIYVRQQEAGPNQSNVGDYWYTLSMGNGEKILTSKMYRTRSRAIRAARKFIARLHGPVVFTYRTGTTPTRAAERLALGHTSVFANMRVIEERIGFPTDGDLIVDTQ